MERAATLAEMPGDGEVERGIEQRQHRLARRAQPPAPPVLRVVLEQPLQPPRQSEPRYVRRPRAAAAGCLAGEGAVGVELLQHADLGQRRLVRAVQLPRPRPRQREQPDGVVARWSRWCVWVWVLWVCVALV